MTDQNLEELRQRWEADPGSRVFLQLAEEYRRLGRTDEAIQVLEQGLERSPNHLSAKVALGRCLLEREDFGAAAGVFEEVIERDPTQLVANRLLVEAYLGQGEPAKAARRLDLYRLLNDSDPAIETLQSRLDSAVSDPEVTASGSADDRFLAEASELDSERVTVADKPLADLLPRKAPEAEEDLFPDLHADLKQDQYLESLGAEGLFAAPTEPAPSVMAAEPDPVDEPEPSPELAEEGAEPSSQIADEDQLFDLFPPVEAPKAALPDLFAELGAEGGDRDGEGAKQVEPLEAPEEPIFKASDEVSEARTEVEPAEAEKDVQEEDPPAAEAEREENSLAAASAEPEQPPAAEEETAEETAAEDSAFEVEGLATVTLGNLYRSQGHEEEAQEAFRKVLERQPDNAAALEALGLDSDETATEEVAEEAEPVRASVGRISARDLLEGVPSTEGLTGRKIHVLRNYLRRIRQEA